MKIYFEDGRLLPQYKLPFKYDHKIDAGDGYSDCEYALDYLCANDPGSVVYTNTIIALHRQYAWNRDYGVFEIYMRCGEDKVFHRIDELTQRELREAHNIMSMYMANEFRNLRE
jgi:hypothetical protein